MSVPDFAFAWEGASEAIGPWAHLQVVELRGTEVALPDGATTRYAYDALDDLARVEHDGFQLVLQRDRLGREVARGDGEGRFSIRNEYDSMDRVIEQRVELPELRPDAAQAPGGSGALRSKLPELRPDAAQAPGGSGA